MPDLQVSDMATLSASEQANLTFNIELAESNAMKVNHTARNVCRQDVNAKAIKYGFRGHNDCDLVHPHYQG